jgi:hypothetical protein
LVSFPAKTAGKEITMDRVQLWVSQHPLATAALAFVAGAIIF